MFSDSMLMGLFRCYRADTLIGADAYPAIDSE